MRSQNHRNVNWMGPWRSPHSKQDYHECYTMRSAVSLLRQVVRSLQGRSSQHFSGPPGGGSFPNGHPTPPHLLRVAVAPCYILWHHQAEFGSVIFIHALQTGAGTSPFLSACLTLHLRSRPWTMMAALSWTSPVFPHPQGVDHPAEAGILKEDAILHLQTYPQVLFSRAVTSQVGVILSQTQNFSRLVIELAGFQGLGVQGLFADAPSFSLSANPLV